MQIPGMRSGQAALRWTWNTEIPDHLVLFANDFQLASIYKFAGGWEAKIGKEEIITEDDHPLFDDILQAKERIEALIGMCD